MHPREAAVIIIFDATKREVLLVKRRDVPVWVLPGGGIDAGETPEAAALREAREETGFQVEIVRKVAEYEPLNRLTQPTHFFECRIVSGQPELSHEVQDVRFFPLDAFPKTLAPPYPSWIADACLNSPGVIRKKISGVSYWVLLKHLFLHPILVFRFLLTKIGIHLND